MKHIFLPIALLFLLVFQVNGQQNSFTIQKFVLDNGLTVILNPDPNAVGVFGAVAVKAGSKNDPADATGMAHYLEHLLFKGTKELGTTDYAKEKPYLDSIVYYYDLLGKTSDEMERKHIQKLINLQSIQGAKYANPTEFDKLIKSIGGTELNAFTAMDMTVYLNAFPATQIDKWLDLYAHRFQNPVFRSFQSELEVVYEEKNRGMDNPFGSLIESLHAKVFASHPYGTQTTIGTVEHLKNPSLTKMYKYFNDYYVANNMALVISGNFDVTSTTAIIKEKFSKLRSGVVPTFPSYPQSKFEKPELMEVNRTPIKFGLLAYKTFASRHKDQIPMEICLRLLNNSSETGSLNKLQLNGNLLFSNAFNLTYNDDGAAAIMFGPKFIGQSFEEAEKLIYKEIEKLKKGEFSDTNIRIIQQELERERKAELEDEHSKCMTLVYLFSEGSSWEEYLAQTNQINQISKEDIMRVANTYFIDNHFTLRSSMGFPEKTTLEKPGFDPVVADQKIESAYCKNFLANMKESGTPKMLDYNKDAKLTTLFGKSDLYITPNPYNDIFTLKMVRAVGSDSIANLDLSAYLFNNFFTKELSRDQLKQAFALHGISYYASATNNRFSIEFTGLEGNLKKALPLIKSLVYEPLLDEQAIKTMVDGEKSNRQSELKNPDLMGRVLLDYARYGNQSEYLTRTTLKNLEKITTENVLALYHKTEGYKTTWHFVGNTQESTLKNDLEAIFPADKGTKFIPYLDKLTMPITKNKIYLVNDKKAVQGQVYFFLNGANYSGLTNEIVNAQAFNSYMSDGFSGLLMQEIREYRSLAYTTDGMLSTPNVKNNPNWFFSYVGCQMDKTNDATAVMDSILRFMPKKPERIDMVKAGLINSMSSNYPNFRYISTSIATARDMGYTYSPAIDRYPLYKSLTFDNIVDFYNTNLVNRPRIITIYGNLKLVDKKKLAQYGDIEVIKLKQIRID
jgi:zinc protease